MTEPTTLSEVQLMLAAQVGAAVILTLSFLEMVFVALAAAFGLRKTTLGLIAAWSATVFWVPSVVTMYLAPTIFAISVFGLIYAFVFVSKSTELSPLEHQEGMMTAPGNKME